MGHTMDISTTYEQLGGLEKKALQAIVRCLGNHPFTWETAERVKPRTMTGAEWKTAIVRLRQSKLLRTYRKTWGERLFLIAGEHYKQLHSLCTPSLEELADGFSKEPGSEQVQADLSEYRPTLGFELLRFLSTILGEPLNVKKDGTIHKRSIHKIMSCIQLKDEDLSHLEWSYAYQDLYPPVFAVLLDFSLRLGFVRIIGNTASVEREVIESWMKVQTIRQIDHLMYNQWMELCLPNSITLQHFALGLDRMASKGWIEVEKLARWAGCCVDVEKSAAELAAEAEQGWLKPLAAFGWVELGVCSGSRVCRMQLSVGESPEAEASLPLLEQALFVQPDFELLAPIQSSAFLIWMLFQTTELKRTDAMCSFHISKSSYIRAHEQGYPVSRLIDEMARFAKYGIPDNVAAAIEDWRKQLGRIEIRELLALTCIDRQTADELEALPAIQPFLMSRLGERDFMIDRRSLTELKSQLEHAGYAPSVQGTDKLNEHSRDEDSLPRLEALIYPNRGIPSFSVETDPPLLEECYPRLADVPAMWLNQYRVYHSSTRKEIIRQAIEWQTALRLRRNGKDIRFAPDQLVQGREEWTVTGIESAGPVSLRSDEWEEMQLILPGINDNN
jgi:hypothetical protein